MKLTNKQINAIATKIKNEINESIKNEKKEFLDSGDFEKAVILELKKYKQAFELLDKKIISNFCVKVSDFQYKTFYTGLESSVKEIMSKDSDYFHIDIMSKSGFNKKLINNINNIENDIVIATINNPDLDSIIESIKVKYTQ
jgi:hypothetical protein